MAKLFYSIKNHVLVGLAIGLGSPLILGSIAWYLMHHTTVFKKADLLLIGCVAVNLVWVNYFNKINKENIGRGIVSATFLCAFVFFFYKIMQEV
ncbi:stationary phase survival protein SurE [Pedobacter sp. SL55]|uniref:stationary phase survival protein SurE n=1 Tax=Pedobacter sp. SL55 TaxID=2995161 RepID=UPI00227184EE|nr:stationary phase survival protein SurE [Pedobacter sp. SL55]WAC40135.1 stationary phase survival protein SurE [Pedobacter sp. SL55]